MTTDPYAETDIWPTVPATRLHSDAQPVSAPEPSGSTPEAARGARESLLEAEVAQLRRQWHQECDNFERECNRADVAERERDAALAALASRDTYTEEGGLIVVGQLREQRARAEAAEAESARLASVVAAVEALFREPYRAADSLCSVLHPERRETCTGFATNDGFFVSCVECKALAARIGADVRAALASVGVSGSADDRREANASQAPDTATPGEADDKAGER
jgi:hypothetical protein